MVQANGGSYCKASYVSWWPPQPGRQATRSGLHFRSCFWVACGICDVDLASSMSFLLEDGSSSLRIDAALRCRCQPNIRLRNRAVSVNRDPAVQCVRGRAGCGTVTPATHNVKAFPKVLPPI